MAVEGERYSLSVDELIEAHPAQVWKMLTDPVKMGELFWGSTVESDFTPGHPIVWKGVWQGKSFEDRGSVQRIEENVLLQVTHWTPSSGPETAENHTVLTWRIRAEGTRVCVTLDHENIRTKESRDHNEGMWKQLLGRRKETLEKPAG